MGRPKLGGWGMNTRFFVHHKGSHVGPFTFADIEARLQRSDLTPADFVFEQERGDWIPISEFLAIQKPRSRTEFAPPNQAQPSAQWKAKSSPNAFKRPPPRLPPPPTLSERPPSKANASLPLQLDLSTKVSLEVRPPKTIHFSFEFLGESRVGDPIEIVVRALSEDNQVEMSFDQTLGLECDQPLSGLTALVFHNGEAKIKVTCLNSGRHQFQLVPPTPPHLLPQLPTQIEGAHHDSLELLNSRIIQ